ncbi:MAG TPA: hypothetical protein VI916_05730 [Acidimicrobiia bacterium]|nr:hypothetical protein [Acidimicrobiia bacterium]
MGVPLILGAYALWLYRHFHFDDSHIMYRYVDNLISGNGWTFNPGEAWNASTSVLNPIVTAGVSIVVGGIPRAAHLVGMGALVAGTVAIAITMARRGWRFAALGVAAATPVLPELLSTWGIETQLFLGLVLLWMAIESTGRSSWILLGLIVLARPDGAVIAGLKVAHEVLQTRRVPWSGLARFGAVLTPWLLFSLFRFGTLFPETLSVKIAHRRHWGDHSLYFDGLRDTIKNWLGDGWVVVAVLGVAGFVIVLRSGYVWLAYLGGFAILQQMAYVAVSPQTFFWYFSIFQYAMVFYALIAIQAVVREGRRVEIAAGSLVAIWLLLLWFPSRSDVPATSVPVYREIAAYIDSVSASDTTIAMSETGTVAYHSPLETRLIDITGLTSPNGLLILPENMDGFFAEPPEFIVMHSESRAPSPYGPGFPSAVGVWERMIFGDPRFPALYAVDHKVSCPTCEFTIFRLKGKV